MNDFYASLDIHRRMLLDDVRNEVYRKALIASVKEGDAVLDFGAGTGILSLFAAQAGARRVYAVERTTMAERAKQIIAANGFADRIEVIQGEMERIRLPEKVDVIVSEWLGTFGVDENLVTPLLIARDRWLKPGGIMLPEHVTAYMAPFWSADVGFFRNRASGLDLSLLMEGNFDELMWPDKPIPQDDFLSEPQAMWTTSVYEETVEQSRLPSRAFLTFKAERAGKINALASWFQADFGNDLVLSTAPDAPPTHWRQYVIPLRRAAEVEAGTPITVEYTCIPAFPGFCHHAWSVRVGTGAWEHHDTRGSATNGG